MRTYCFLFIVAWMALPVSSQAAPAVTCHCFSERTLNPDRPKAVDEYLLATTYNSFMATVLRIEKKAIVRAKMTGTPDEDIWMLHWSIKESGKSVNEIRQLKAKAGTWLAFARQEQLLQDVKGTNHVVDDQSLALVIAKFSAASLFNVSPQQMDDLKRDGASIKELVLACFLSTKAGTDPRELFHQSRSNSNSWGLIAQSAGLDFTTVELEMKNLKRAPEKP